MDAEGYRELVELVRSVRHDANNPLTAALGHVQLLLADPAVEDAEVLESLRTVETELRRLSTILGRLAQPRETAPAGGAAEPGSAPRGEQDPEAGNRP